MTRSLFQFSRRERELLSFDLVFETRTRISFSKSRASRREREFLSLILVLRDENENFFFQSRTSRREWESRLRQFSREFLGITFIACLITDIFQKKQLFSQNFLKYYVSFFSRNLNTNLIFETRMRISFSQSRASRREQESRLRQVSRELSGITLITCLLTGNFQKRLLFSKNFLE